MKHRTRLIYLLAPLSAFFLAFWLLPFVRLIAMGFDNDRGSNTMAYIAVLTNSQYLNSFFNTVVLSLAVSLAAVILAGFSAFFLARNHFPGKHTLVAMLTFPLAFPGVVIGFFVIITTGRQGILNQITTALFDTRAVLAYSLSGLFIGYLYFSIPRVISTVMAACDKLDTSLEEAARSLGAPPFAIAKDVILPALAPALFATGAICFATAMGAFGTIFALGTRIAVVPLSIYSEFTNYANFTMAAAMSVLLGLLTWLTLLIAQRLTGLKQTGAMA